jgi:membrane protease YdiL (CAAX protease family)
MMFGLSMGLGYLFEEAGLIAAMTAHAVYDIIMLKLVQGRHPEKFT